MKLSVIHESDDGLPHNTRVWTPESHQGKPSKHWYQKYAKKAKQYTWPRHTYAGATGYKDHILKP